MQVKTVTLPEKRLAGFVCRTTTVDGRNLKDVPAFWRDYIGSGRMKKLNAEAFVKDHRHYGVWFHEDPVTRILEYFAGVEVGRDDPVPPEYEVRELRPASYMVFPSFPPAASGPELIMAVQKTYARIYGEWIPRLDCDLNVRASDFELYDEDIWTGSDRVCQIHIPFIPQTQRQ